MRFHPQAGITRDKNGEPLSDDPGRRRMGRVGLEAVVCDLGLVRDLSASGMRILCKKPPRGAFTTTIRGLGSEVEVDCRMAWSKRVGLFKHEVGIKFIDVTEEQAQSLTRMGMNNRKRTTMWIARPSRSS